MMQYPYYTILGAGLACLSCAYHLGHANCQIFEAKGHPGGHVFSHQRDGFVWDEGPHVSFTESAYVRELFEQSVKGEYLDYPVSVSNYYQGAWLPHPPQSNLYAVPEPLRTACLNDFLKTRAASTQAQTPAHYGEWLKLAFGPTFADTFPAAYTRKYWTAAPPQLTTDWVGNRIFYPDIETVKHGYHQPAAAATHYIKTVRYPTQGGYIAFAKTLLAGANIHLQHQVARIDLPRRIIFFSNGKTHQYERLISTLPLPELVRLAQAPADILEAANQLACTSLLLVNVTANHPTKLPYHWLYVYDEDKFSTRINCTELLSPNNAPSGKTGVQVEVYASPYKPFPATHADIANKVVAELQTMGLIDEPKSVHTQSIPHANILFDHPRRAAQNAILTWLESYGLEREAEDLEPMTEWERVPSLKPGIITLAGRFGQWKYYWSDDCVLRGRYI